MNIGVNNEYSYVVFPSVGGRMQSNIAVSYSSHQISPDLTLVFFETAGHTHLSRISRIVRCLLDMRDILRVSDKQGV